MLDIFLNLYNQIKPLSTKSERKTEVLFSYSCSNHLNLEKQKSFSVVTRLKKKKEAVLCSNYPAPIHQK